MHEEDDVYKSTRFVQDYAEREGQLSENLHISHASYLAMLPPRSTKKEDRHSAAGEEKKRKKNQPTNNLWTQLQKNKGEDLLYAIGEMSSFLTNMCLAARKEMCESSLPVKS